jgi:outer membrane biosynthesis protein TonB
MSSIPAVQWFARADRTLGSQPEALEVAVEVSGARAAGPTGVRELFSEATTTTLVFEDGAVVRLSAPVLVGQLVFLRHQQTQKEIVTRVLRQRSFGTATAYVELEFSEAAPGFWGQEGSSASAVIRDSVVENVLSEQTVESTPGADLSLAAVLAPPSEGDSPASPPANSQVSPRVDSHVTAHGSAHVPPAAPDAEEVAKLRAELAGLRMQMSSMAQAGSAPDGEAIGATSIATKMLASRRPKVDSSSEMPRDEERSEGRDSATPSGVEMLTPGSVKVRVGLIAALLILGLVAASAYCEGFLADWYAKRNVISASLGASVPARVVAKNASRPTTAAITTNGSPSTAVTAVRATATERAIGAGGSTDSHGAAGAPAQGQSEDPNKSAEQTRSADNSYDTGAANDGSHLEAVLSNGNNHPVSMTAVAEESYEPPSLIKAVNAVPPPDAIRGFVTGDVKFEALIDTAGKVSSATVISGPAALRAAALEALRHYEYKPASKNGQSVAARVTVAVKFWYEP